MTPENDGAKLSTEQKAWVDAVSDVRRAAVERFNARRDLEWKLALTIWGGLIVAANALKDEHLEQGWNWKWVAVVGGVGVIVLLHLLWEACFVAPSAERDRNAGRDLDIKLREVLGVGRGEDADAPYGVITAHVWQVGVTAVLAVFVVLAVTR